ncbi:hypothetical protein CgunFtcFv8_008538 [Champsocephalus gunnari]|uniref:Dynamin N-terminal domain-containing protein n=1 Tax=Champsocephalus gunnari TaxID=52237 RepID=A0AAN8D259_CHAGU|nr:hypothetical protein CgunFtcFv8_008538 [Champsocephalus gunnari]
MWCFRSVGEEVPPALSSMNGAEWRNCRDSVEWHHRSPFSQRLCCHPSHNISAFYGLKQRASRYGHVCTRCFLTLSVFVSVGEYLLFLIMDDFVHNKLTQWDLSELIQTFKEQHIDKEALYELDDQTIAELIPIVGTRLKFKKRLKLLLEEQNTTDPETSESSVQCKWEFDEEAVFAQVCPSPNKANDEGKRRLDLQGESSQGQSPARKRPREDIQGSYTEEVILSDVKNIMRCVRQKLPNQDDKLNKFLKNSIKYLETDKREVVGVFGRTGAGKSSLINAVIGVKDLLPSGDISACTSVMIRVEANMHNPKYEAEIEFITKEEWKEELEIPEFLQSKNKILTSDTAKELSAKCVKYTRSESKEEDAKDVKRWYWPLVKCVTFRVPKNDFLQHVTLVDLPGNGDRNKSRDRMWKKVVGSCSTVWIVAEINRAAAEKEPWEILEESCSLMGNGGECRQIHFICTKSDNIGGSDDQSAAGVRAQILKRNKQAKIKVMAEFSKLKEVKKHFSVEYFKVFTVSSEEFLRRKNLDRDDTEIPSLQEFLQDLNEWHSETLNYVSGAHGILSLIQGASIREGADIKTTVCKGLEEKLSLELDKSVLYPTKKGGAFHRILNIDEEFKKTFPNEGNSGPFNGVINAFSLGTEKLMNKECENVKLQLTFLKTEEEKMKTKLNKLIRERKKTIYSSLTTTIEETMQECYDRAKEIRGEGSLKNMRETIEMHVHGSKNVMFVQAKDAMNKQLRDLMLEILEKLDSTMQESIELSLKTDGDSIPDVSVELEMVKNYYNELTECPDDDAILCID